MLEDWSLLKAHTNLHLISEYMLLCFMQFLLLYFNHCLEINVYFDTLKLIVSFSLTFQFSYFFHFHTSCISIDFYLIDFIRCCYFPWLHIASLSCHQSRFGHCQVWDGALRNSSSWLCLWLYAVLLFEAVFPFLGGTIGGQTFIFQLIKHCLGWHLVDLMLLLQVL